MKTTVAILEEIRRHKTCSVTQLYRYFAAFNITPLGVRQRPQVYPDDAGERILEQLGLASNAGCGVPGCPNTPRRSAAPTPARPGPKIDTMNQLRAIRSRSTGRATA